jgi:phosphoenolpyruvate carboxykinase (ATP)
MSSFDLESFYKCAENIWKKAQIEARLTENPSEKDLRILLEKEPGIKKTIYSNFVAESEPTSRSAMFTKNSVDCTFGDDEKRFLSQCEEVLNKEKLISCDCQVGAPSNNTTVRLIVPERFAHVAYGGRNLFCPVTTKQSPTYYILFFADKAFETNKNKPLPQKDITIRLAMLKDGRFVKIIRNGSYIGEFKKGVFAAEDWTAKTFKNGIFLHAGCREDYIEDVHGDYRLSRTLLVALSANGKTSTTSRILAKKGHEQSWLVQDDGGTLLSDGSFHGFEGGGIFVKTEAVNPGEQKEIYYGLLKRETVLENVQVTDKGEFDLYDFQKTSNGRAVVLRRDFMHASQRIDVEKINNLILITRGPLIPAISRLTAEQAAAMMVVGQAMESSAGDPTKAGQIRSEFFYDPFVAGDLAEHANRFFDIIKSQKHMNFYLLNTGWVGEGDHYLKIQLDHTMGILESLLRGGLEDWIDSPTGFQVPKAIRVVDDIYLHPEKLYTKTDFETKQSELNKMRKQAVDKIGKKLHAAIRKVFN